MKCDAAKPSCSQCRRAKRQCSGYRNVDELRLVDQSSEVSWRVKKSKKPTNPGPGYEVVSSPSSASSEEAVEISYPLSNFVPASFWLEGTAKDLFFQQYICFSSKSELDFVSSLYKAQQANDMLESIVVALGLVSLPRQNRDGATTLLASQKYLSAIRQTQVALQDPELAKSDQALATVLLLGLHELIAFDDAAHDLGRLSVHLNGALRMLQLRGDAQLKTFGARRMYDRVCTQMIYTSIRGRRQIPPALLRISKALQHQMHREEISGVELLDIASRLCMMLEAADRIQDVEDATTVVHVLLALDRELAIWEASLSFRFDVTRVPIENPDKSFLRFKEVYFNRVAGAGRSRYRSVRIATNEELLRIVETYPEVVDAAGPDAAVSVERAKATIVRLSQEICQSVPYFLGQESLSSWIEHSAEPPTMYGGAAMLMPLWFAANPKRIPPAMHQWLIQQVGRIADETGLSKAKQLFADRQVDEVG